MSSTIKIKLTAPSGALDQRLTVSSSPVWCAPFADPTTHVFWDVQAQPVMVTLDGSTPTASNGHLLSPGSSGTWTRTLFEAAKWIRQGGTDATVHASPLVN